MIIHITAGPKMDKYEGFIIRQLTNEELTRFQEIAIRAYPVMLPDNYTAEAKQAWLDRMKKENADTESGKSYFGCFKKDLLLGGMIYFDFEMTLFDHQTNVGGVGLICVDLLHKKEHVAKNIMKAFHDHYHSRGVTITALYPFRPDFYVKMGYGLGRKMNLYRFKPSSLPKTSKNNIVSLGPSDNQKIAECFNRFASLTHGMIQKTEKSFEGLLTNSTVVGYKKNDDFQGFLAFRARKVDPDNFILQNIVIRELIYENTEALAELLTYLYTQADQVQDIIYHTQDDFFHYLLEDPRNGGTAIFLTSQESNLQGLGIMYRVINARKLFSDLNLFNFNNQTVQLKMEIKDDFLSSNDGILILHFNRGRVQVMEDTATYDVEIKLKIEHFSSIFMGVVPFTKLVNLGLVEISDIKYIAIVNRLFLTGFPPMTTQQF